jgi:predicted dehydrogenase
MNKIGVGIIGASIGRWAADAHIPALRAVPDFELRALCTSRPESAEAAARHFGVPLAFHQHTDLVNSPEVDVVVVTVKVPHHRELVLAAIAAGKTVFCEWPLGNGLDEACEMASQARSMGVLGVVGLQSRCSPTLVYMRDLIRAGYVGEILSTTLIGPGMAWAGPLDRLSAYLADRRNGATMLTITFGHTVDALLWVLGEFESLNATLGYRRKQVTILESGETIPMTAADQIVVGGTLQSGTVASIQYRAGLPRGTKLLWEIVGTGGELRITADGGHIGATPLTLSGAPGDEDALRPLEIPDSYRRESANWPTGAASNVARAYVKLARDMREGTQTSATFADAVVRHRMIDAIETAAKTGRRQVYPTESA